MLKDGLEQAEKQGTGKRRSGLKDYEEKAIRKTAFEMAERSRRWQQQTEFFQDDIREAEQKRLQGDAAARAAAEETLARQERQKRLEEWIFENWDDLPDE